MKACMHVCMCMYMSFVEMGFFTRARVCDCVCVYVYICLYEALLWLIIIVL